MKLSNKSMVINIFLNISIFLNKCFKTAIKNHSLSAYLECIKIQAIPYVKNKGIRYETFKQANGYYIIYVNPANTTLNFC